MDSIEKAISCRWCLRQFVDPVSLPCGNSICERDIQELREQNWKCLLCDGIHQLLAESERFPPNKPLIDLLALNLSRLDFGPAYKEAKQQVNDFELANRAIIHMMQEPRDCARALTNKYRNQVDLKREEVIKIVDDVCVQMNQQIAEYEHKVEENIKKEWMTMKNLVESNSIKIKSWNERFNELSVNESLWKEIGQEAKSLQEEIEHRRGQVLDPPSAIRNLSKVFESNLWSELAKRSDEKSVIVRNLSLFAKQKIRNSVFSEPFTLNGANFVLVADIKEKEFSLDVYLYKRSGHPKKLTWIINVLGKNFETIFSEVRGYDFNEFKVWGLSKPLLIEDILAHPAYNPMEDSIRVEVVFKEEEVYQCQA